MREIVADLCVIGAGAAGLTAAAGACRMGARTVLIEARQMGGECLNAGCVPSKALIAAARVAHAVRQGARFGIGAGEVAVDHRAVHAHVAAAIAAIAPHDSEERFRAMGCTVLRDHGRFVDGRTVEVAGRRVRARRFVIATGSRPIVPPILGLADAVPFTNETIFANDAPLPHLAVLGGGPIGCELAQAYRRLGSEVTILERATLLPRDDPEMVAVVRAALQSEGITLQEGAAVTAVHGQAPEIILHLASAPPVRCSHLLVAAGRRPNIESLGLDAAGVAATPAGIAVDGGQRTSNPRIYAIGDVAIGPQFTHLAAHQAGTVLRHALFRLPSRTDLRAVPHVTYTDPELAQVGLTEDEARRSHDGIKVLRAEVVGNDRARTEQREDGLVKVVTTARGRVLGASIVAPQAGELVVPWILAVQQRLHVGSLARMVVPYPTLAELNKRAAGEYYTKTLFGPRIRHLVRLLAMLG